MTQVDPIEEMNQQEFPRKMTVLVDNADEFYGLVKKAQRQSAELANTLHRIENFEPKIRLKRF